MKKFKLLAFVPLFGIDGSSINEGQLINALSYYFERVYCFTFVGLRKIMFGKNQIAVPQNKNVKVLLIPGLTLPIIFLPIVVFYYSIISIFCLIVKSLLSINIVYIRDRYAAMSILMLKSLFKCLVTTKFQGFSVAELPPYEHFLASEKISLMLNSLIDNYLLRKSDVLLVPSLTMKEFIEKLGYINNEVLLCPAGVNINKIKNVKRQKVVKNKKKVRIGFIGSLVWWQGVDLLAHAISIVKKDVPNIELFIVGDGPMRNEIIKLCEINNIPYIFIGAVSHKTALTYLNSFDILVLPRRKTVVTENVIPIKVIEAWAFGIPVVITKHHVLVNSGIRDRENVVYCDPNPQNIAEAILELLKNYEIRRKLQDNGEKIAKQFEYKIIAERIFKTLMEKISKKCSASSIGCTINSHS